MNDNSSEDKTRYDTTTYQGRRMLNKNGIIAGTFLFFKSTMGLGFLINQYFQGKSGFILGNLLTLILCFLVAYYSDVMLQIANKIESQSHRKIQIDSFDYVAGYVWAKISIILYNQSMIIVNTTNLAKFLQSQLLLYCQQPFAYNIDYYKFFVILSFLIILLFILEPEKLKYLSYFATFVLILALILMWILNFQIYINWQHKPKWEYYNFLFASDLIGNQLYSLESVGTLFTVRSTLKKRRKMRDILKYAYGIILIIFFLNGTTFLFVFQKELWKQWFIIKCI